MIDDRDIERPSDLIQTPGRLDILLSWRRVTAGVIVHKNDSGCIMLEGAAKNSSRVDGHLRQRPLLKLFVRYQPARFVEEQDAQHFLVKRSHRCDQIATERWTKRVDSDPAQIAFHRLQGCFARANN